MWVLVLLCCKTLLLPWVKTAGLLHVLLLYFVNFITIIFLCLVIVSIDISRLYAEKMLNRLFFLSSGVSGSPMPSSAYSGGYKDCCRWIDTPNIRNYYRRSIATIRNSNAASCKLRYFDKSMRITLEIS